MKKQCKNYQVLYVAWIDNYQDAAFSRFQSIRKSKKITRAVRPGRYFFLLDFFFAAFFFAMVVMTWPAWT